MNKDSRPTRQCRSCGAPIVWAVTEAGKRMPLDAEPHPGRRGQFIFTSPDTVRYGKSGTPIPEGVETFVSHFSTCPNRKAHRKVKPPKHDTATARGILAAFRGGAPS